jgi:HEPN domain-containing protein
MSIDEISQSVAEVVLELMEDSIDWRISDCYPNTEGDEYNAIRAEILFRTVEKMYMSTKRTYYEVD